MRFIPGEWVKREIPFIKFPTILIDAESIGVGHWAVYLAIRSHRNSKTKRCDPSVETIARETGLGEKTVKRKRNELKRLNILDWKRRKQRTCLYCFPFEDDPFEKVLPTLKALKKNDGNSMIEGWFSKIDGNQEGSPGPFLDNRRDKISKKHSRRGRSDPQERVVESLSGGHQDPTNKKNKLEEVNKKKRVVPNSSPSALSPSKSRASGDLIGIPAEELAQRKKDLLRQLQLLKANENQAHDTE
jgi:hypothetical protein